MKPVTVKFNHWLPKLLGASGTTLGHTIYLAGPKSADANTKILFNHEMEHVRQLESSDGLFSFLFVYFIQWVKDGFKYKEIDYEEQAYALQNTPLDPDEEKEWKKWFT